jgi:hypothetical protein
MLAKKLQQQKQQRNTLDLWLNMQLMRGIPISSTTKTDRHDISEIVI